MTSTQVSSNTKENKSAKKKQSFGSVDVGSPKVPLRQRTKTEQQHELLSDWEHAS